MRGPDFRCGLYLHVPFCVRKCGYCDFYSLPHPESVEAPDAARYLAALEVELARLSPGFAPATIFVGGGTPTELAAADLARLLALVREKVDTSRVVEWTCESNPGTLTREKATLLREAGVDRVSLGVQSLDAGNLAFLGRIHSAEEAVAGYRLLREVGFENVNLDFIYAIPTAGAGEALERDLARVTELAPEHTSWYGLIFEEGTPLWHMRERGLVRPVEDEVEAVQYERVRAALRAAGYVQYEISNYARPGRECRHNLLYWGAGEYVGVGPSAHSHWGGARWGNERSLERWCDALLSGREPRAFEERLEPEARAREALVMYLRRTAGVSREEFARATGLDLDALCGDALRRLGAIGALEDDGDRVRLAERALVVSDAVLAELV